MNDIKKPAYTSLAEIYDTVMQDVDYEVWADFIDEIIQVHHPNPETVLELACGTGSLAFALNRYGCYKLMGTDKSAEMIAKADKKHPAKMPISHSGKWISLISISIKNSILWCRFLIASTICILPMKCEKCWNRHMS